MFQKLVPIQFLVLLPLLASSVSFAGRNAKITSFDAESIRQFAYDNGIQSIDELLPHFPDYMKSDYAMIYGSKSIQGSSKTAPRILLFGSQPNSDFADYVYAYNGDPAEERYKVLEMMQFN